jgi:hypothetical protein
VLQSRYNSYHNQLIMNKLFLDSNQPLSTCSLADCTGCPLQHQLQCHFSGRELLRFFGIAFPPFILGGIGIVRMNTWMLLPWVGLVIAYFGFVEIRVMCSHCPHYAEPGIKSLQCWANYGSPKLWKFRPGPMTKSENIVFFTGLVLIGIYPLAFLLLGAQWILLVFFILTVTGMALLMGRLMCSRCMNFACPFNSVEKTLRETFFAHNPIVGQAWQGKGTNREGKDSGDSRL